MPIVKNIINAKCLKDVQKVIYLKVDIAENKYVLVPPNCCSTVSIVGAKQSSLDKLYVLNGTIISGRPLYVDSTNLNGIWFSGTLWMVGTISDLNEGKLAYGFLHNDGEFGDCPGEIESWTEYYDSSWGINDELTMECDG